MLTGFSLFSAGGFSDLAFKSIALLVVLGWSTFMYPQAKFVRLSTVGLFEDRDYLHHYINIAFVRCVRGKKSTGCDLHA